MKDCCRQEIVPCASKLSVHTNRHTSTDGTLWGWIEGCTSNICWANNTSFNETVARRFVKEYNEREKMKDSSGQELSEWIETEITMKVVVKNQFGEESAKKMIKDLLNVPAVIKVEIE